MVGTHTFLRKRVKNYCIYNKVCQCRLPYKKDKKGHFGGKNALELFDKIFALQLLYLDT